jgi:hypothetical protein
VTGPEISAVPREARPYQGTTAGFVTRFVANVIDTVVVVVMLGACYVGLASVKFLLDPRAFEFPDVSFLASLTVALFLATVYLWLAWWLAGRTYGGHVMGIRVTGRRRPKLGPLRALARAAFCTLFPIGFFWCLISPHRRSIQDAVLFSSVVYDWLPHPSTEHGEPREEHATRERGRARAPHDPAGGEEAAQEAPRSP